MYCDQRYFLKNPIPTKKTFIQEAAFLLNEEKEKSGAVDRPDLPLPCSAWLAHPPRLTASRPHAYSVRSGPHVNENKSMCSSARNRFRPTVSAWPVYQLSSFLHTIPYTPIRRHGPHAQPSYALVAMNPVHAIITVAQALGRLSGAITAVMTASNSA